MAATDKTYRSQRTLDIVFALTCLLMLVSVIWMFVQDYNREFKVEQRDFRDVEEAVAQRQLLRLVPDKQKRQVIAKASESLADTREARDKQAAEVAAEIRRLKPIKARAEARAQSIKADYDSAVSIYNIEVERRDDADPDSPNYPTLEHRVDDLRTRVDDLAAKLADAQAEVEKVNRDIDAQKAKQRDADNAVDHAEKKLKEYTADFDRFAKLQVQKRWKAGDWTRALPVLDAFASPIRIQQVTLNDLPIDYNFKQVTRFDRCTTCHQGIDRPAYTQQALLGLTQDPSKEEEERLNSARDMLEVRKDNGETVVNPGDVTLKRLSDSKLNPQRVREYCAHPRLDLFVDANSPHPSEKFGCTICHSGQGSATQFTLAAHTPNNAEQRQRWMEEEDWEPSHFWDFPMLPDRFVESSCIKCHHQVLDLTPEWDQQENRRVLAQTDKGVDIKQVQVPSPGNKVVAGFNLIRDNGCFGCHEISGTKGGREVGPDLRLEPYPPLQDLTPTERAKLVSDPTNPPGAERKVGPSLRRISEKTNQEWARRWILSPRGFRPDTKMPHFYGLSNNRPEVLPEDQKKFPDTEIHAIAYYLFRESKDYLTGSDTYYTQIRDREKELEQKLKDRLISEPERKELDEVKRRLQIAATPIPIKQRLLNGEGTEVQLPRSTGEQQAKNEQIHRGRQLFTEKGCLACHSHNGTAQRDGDLPAVVSEQNFGPNLSNVATKIIPEGGDRDSGRRWLVQWIMNPNVHSPRTRMPITHLTEDQAADVAAWLLSQRPEEWDVKDPAAPSTEVLEKLARIWLEKAMSHHEANAVLENKGLSSDDERIMRENHREADELRLASSRHDETWGNKLKWYVGKKAISQLGCFGCHDIPGFEWSKPVGTPLNDWGKKDPERIAFEDINAYVANNYHPVPGITDAKGHGYGPDKKGRPAYEEFFWTALEHRHREGFLNQKIREPRSYDYNRMRTWDDRLRMPQFKFARKVKPLEGETPEQAEERAEAEARDAVMTFVLGLVAEPVPLKFVSDPPADLLAETKGKHVLEKFNCAGCHQLRPGIFELNTRKPSTVLKDLEDAYKGATSPSNISFQGDIPFPEHNAWVGRPSGQADRLTVRGLPTGGDEDQIKLRLTDAAHFTKKPEDVTDPNDADELKPGDYDIPAAEYVGVATKEILSKAEPHGGVLTELLTPYLVQRKPSPYLDDDPKARSGLPPPLLREGEKVQSAWLFRFLKNPYPLRKVTILRMPKFNMSDDDANALVNYFAAVDRRLNPGIGLQYPYEPIAERDDNFLSEQAQPYAARLGASGVKQRAEHEQLASQVWDQLLKTRVEEVSSNLKSAEEAVKSAKDAEKKEAEKRRDSLKDQLAKLQEESKQDHGPFHDEVRRQWEQQDIYAADAYRLLTNVNLCQKCHQIGSMDANQPIGPALDMATERLRPGWTQRWISNPQRMLVFPVGGHPMPQYFLQNKPQEYQDLFSGLPREQATALRDILMNYQKVVNMPENRFYRPGTEAPKPPTQ